MRMGYDIVDVCLNYAVCMLHRVVVFILSNECIVVYGVFFFFFFQAEDGIRDAQESRGLGDVYKRQPTGRADRA